MDRELMLSTGLSRLVWAGEQGCTGGREIDRWEGIDGGIHLNLSDAAFPIAQANFF